MHALLLTGLALLGGTALPAAELVPFSASYSVSWHGMAAGTSQLQLERLADGSWLYGSQNRPRGLFRLALPSELSQRTRFTLHEGAVRPLHFEASGGSSDGKRSADLRFDWNAGHATGRSGNADIDLPLVPGLQDAMSIQISLMQSLLQGQAPTRFQMLDGDRIKEYIYQREGDELLSTGTGGHRTVVFRSLRPGATRSTWFWCAPDLNYLPVKVERRNGSKVEWSMSLLEVRLEGTTG